MLGKDSAGKLWICISRCFLGSQDLLLMQVKQHANDSQNDMKYCNASRNIDYFHRAHESSIQY